MWLCIKSNRSKSNNYCIRITVCHSFVKTKLIMTCRRQQLRHFFRLRQELLAVRDVWLRRSNSATSQLFADYFQVMHRSSKRATRPCASWRPLRAHDEIGPASESSRTHSSHISSRSMRQSDHWMEGRSTLVAAQWLVDWQVRMSIKF